MIPTNVEALSMRVWMFVKEFESFKDSNNFSIQGWNLWNSLKFSYFVILILLFHDIFWVKLLLLSYKIFLKK